MSCNIRIPLQRIIDDVAEALSEGFIKTDNAVLNEPVLNSITIRGDITADTAARNALCAILQTCGITAIELEWLDRPTVADMVAVSEVVAGEVVVSWKDLDTLITEGIVGKVQTTDVLDSLGVSQEEINTDIRNELDALPFEDGVLTDTFVTVTANGVGKVARNQRDKNSDTVTPFDFGAIGDGVYHPLSERYSTLEQAKELYPHADALTDSVDWAALQAFFNYCKTNFVHADMTLNAYVSRTVVLDGKFATDTFYGNLHLRNTQTDYEIEALMTINVQNLNIMGCLNFSGGGGNTIDMKQLTGLVIGDGGTNGSAGRVYIDTMRFDGFRDFGVALINDSIFPSFRFCYGGSIGATGRDGAGNKQNTTLTSRVDFDGQNNQRTEITVLDLPPDIMGKYGFNTPIYVVHDKELYRVTEVDRVNKKLKLYPQLSTISTDTTIRYIYGAAVGWIGNNAGVGNFGFIQTILCGIGFWSAALYGATVSQLSTEFCGIGMLAGASGGDPAIANTVVDSYFEANVFDYVSNWLNDTKYNAVNFINAHALKLSHSVNLYGWRVKIWSPEKGGYRVSKEFTSSQFFLDGETYSVNKNLSMRTDLTTSADVMLIHPEETIYLTIDEHKVEKLGITGKLLVAPPHTTPITFAPIAGWSLQGTTTLPASTKNRVITARIDGRNLIVHLTGDTDAVPEAKGGTTEQRPVSPVIGAQYFDTTVNKLIVWSGSAWVDASGAGV